jgi:dTDP-4-dehydrorhamnose 3,5-epimerase/reductase
VDDSKFFIVGAGGQLGTALRQKYPNARFADVNELDITNKESVEAYDWSGIEVILNAAAYTNVDGAETAEGRAMCWSVNADAVANLVAVSAHYNATLVHISTDYVFDGTQEPHREDEAFTPLSVYGSSKAAGDIAVSLAPKFYIIRTSWVIGDGKNFVRTMLDLGKKGINPTVVSDQIGRLTFTSELVRAIDHLLSINAPYGTYNVSNDGEPASWADIARAIFKEAGMGNTVTDISTEEYYKDKENIAPRPLKSILDLSKIKAIGFAPENWDDNLHIYITKQLV